MQKIRILKRTNKPMEAPQSAQKVLLRRGRNPAKAEGEEMTDRRASMEEDMSSELPEYDILLSTLESLVAEVSVENERRIIDMMNAERDRLDEVYRTRQETLLRLLAHGLNEQLPNAIQNSLKSEIQKYIDHVQSIAQSTVEEVTHRTLQTALPQAVETAAQASTVDIEMATKKVLKDMLSSAELRSAFAFAFKDDLLPSIEESTRTFLASFASSIGTEVELKLTSVLHDGAERLKLDTKSLIDVTEALASGNVPSVMPSGGEGMLTGTSVGYGGSNVVTALPSKETELAKLLANGEYKEALVFATAAKDRKLTTTAVEQILSEDAVREKISEGLSCSALLLVMSALASGLSTNNVTTMSSRIEWLSDMSEAFIDTMEDLKETPEYSERDMFDENQVEMLREVLQNTAAVSAESLEKEDARAKKMTEHLLKAGLRSVEAM